jgi:hypothetical protein
MFQAILLSQFERTRDGDRLFYLSNAAGLYENGTLKPEIAAIVDLDSLRLSDILELNSGVTGLQENVFFAMLADLDGSGVVDAGDLEAWSLQVGGAGADVDHDADTDGRDLLAWQRQLGVGRILPPPPPLASLVPEPAAAGLIAIASSLVCCRRRSAAPG